MGRPSAQPGLSGRIEGRRSPQELGNLQCNADAALDGGDPKERAHGLDDAALTAYDLTLIVGRHLEADDDPVFFLYLGNGNFIGPVGDRLRDVLNQLLHWMSPP